MGWLIGWWDDLDNEKKSILHFIAHILEFALIIAAVVIAVRIYVIQQERIQAQDVRLQEYYAHLAVSVENMRLYGEWLSVVRAKEGLVTKNVFGNLDSLTTGRSNK